MESRSLSGTRGNQPAWAVVARQELRDLWLGGRGVPLLLAFSVLISVVTYLSGTNQTLNFLERREALNLTLQLAVAVGALLALVVAADAISGERERGTLEALLLTPVSRSHLLLGKLLAALSLWFAALVVTVPYVWFLGRGVGAVDEALLAGLGVGTLLALGLASLGTIISSFAASNRLSLSVSLFVLFALYAPTQFPTGAKQGFVGDFLQRVNPLTAGEHYIGKIVIDGHSWTQDASWLFSPVVAAVLFSVIAVAIAPRMLRLGGSSGG